MRAKVFLNEAAVPSNTNDSWLAIAFGIISVFNSFDAAAIALAASLLSSGVAFFKSKVTLAFFKRLTKVSSILKVFKPPKSISFRI